VGIEAKTNQEAAPWTELIVLEGLDWADANATFRLEDG